jgi:transcriptional regulator with PAS, ATPase and Fis domain
MFEVHVNSGVESRHNMIGDSPRMRDIYRFIAKVAATDTVVLILGESGTGKELAARALHCQSPRADAPFLALNCAVLTENLLESELFGHEKGAFTGAVAQKKGKIELAAGGTLFLDEIGELNPLVQAKLLRVLQERKFERVGGNRSIDADVRVIAATNRDLADASDKGLFRWDLYYRLNVISLMMPALREHREDIPALAKHFIAQHREKAGRRVAGLSAGARACLMSYNWPGNVRELENVIQHALVLGSADVIMTEDLPERVTQAESPRTATNFRQALREAKRNIVTTAIRKAGGDMNQAARSLGIHSTNLYRLIRVLDLKSELGEGAERKIAGL